MTTENKRLSSLIEYTQEAAKLKLSPTHDVSTHEFCEFEHTFRGLPGIHFNYSNQDREIWLALDRLYETASPIPDNQLLSAWLQISDIPTKKPKLRESIEIEKEVTQNLKDQTPDGDQQPNRHSTILALKEHENKSEIESLFSFYLINKWLPWAAEEKKRRQTIKLYNEIFNLKQRLEGTVADDQVEIVWGVGIAVGKVQGRKVRHPILTLAADIQVNDETMALEVGPCDVNEQLEIDVFISANNPGVVDLENTYLDFSKTRAQPISPFEQNSFERVLRAAVKHLDAEGVYWPQYTTPDDRKLPSASEHLHITDTWVLMMRPRSKSIMIQDLERFRIQLNDNNSPEIPNAVRSLLMEPSITHSDIDLPSYRGLSLLPGTGSNTSTNQNPPRELYFPLPFNEQQAQIIQLLECYNGVVVQGPPGTGKTHTIANVISHYLALGKRVLVTSMKEPALSVLKEKLPRDLQPLTINLLMNEKEGMKQFEQSITKISSTVPGLDRAALRHEIDDLGKQLDRLHENLAFIDKTISRLARKQLEPISIDGQTLLPHEAAQKVVLGQGQYEWLPDLLQLDGLPKFTHRDIVKLREARILVGDNLKYLNVQLPEIISLPDRQELLELHQNLSHYNRLEHDLNTGQLIPLISETESIKQRSHALLKSVEGYLKLCDDLIQVQNDWIEEYRTQLWGQQEETHSILEIFTTLGHDLKQAIEARQEFLKNPVSIPQDAELDASLFSAVDKLTQARSPFGIPSWLSRSKAKTLIKEITVKGCTPSSPDEWSHVLKYIKLMLQCRELLSRWNSVGPELSLPAFDSIDPKYLVNAVKYFDLHQLLLEQIVLRQEIDKEACEVVKDWKNVSTSEEQDVYLTLKNTLVSHITRQHLSCQQSKKEEIMSQLASYEAPIICDMHELLNSLLGNFNISKTALLEKWEVQIKALSDILKLRHAFSDILEVSAAIESSGAPLWATQLRSEAVQGVVDSCLPDNWKEAWTLRQLNVYLDEADCREEFRRLISERQHTTSALARTYQDIVVKQTWLTLADRATPRIRSALEAFRAAIAKIGKGTGKRSLRYRRDAREAAARSNTAIPCWIMPHWKVSEALPAEYGAFDLVIIDEASQSDLSALPALLRAKKVLVVGDDKQVSPDAVGVEEEQVGIIMRRYLSQQVADFRAQLSPDRSIYDLFKVVFPESALMLKEHFRCVGPIIEYSKREYYDHELKPMRIPNASERLDPPLIDILIEDGYQVDRSKTNTAEARFIVNEIKKICSDPKLKHRSIGVVSLLANHQALYIWHLLQNELEPQVIKRHSIACGDARSFQGKERDIVFLSMVVTRGNARAMTQASTAQRYNVAASRARNRMYLVRSVEIDDLSPNDHIRRRLIAHFSKPYCQDEDRVENLRELCESAFETEVYDLLTERGYRVNPQVKVGSYRIDMVVEGQNDSRLAIECDGDRYHGADRWDADMNRQRILERAGWRFWRSFASTFIQHRQEMIDDLLMTLGDHGIEPLGEDISPTSIYTMHRRVRISESAESHISPKSVQACDELTKESE